MLKAINDILIEQVVQDAITGHDHQVLVLNNMNSAIRISWQVTVGPHLKRKVKTVKLLRASVD